MRFNSAKPKSEISSGLITITQPDIRGRLALPLQVLSWVLVALTPLTVLLMIAWYAAEVPYYDDWNMIVLFRKAQNATLGFNDLWIQHNEHRIFFPKLLTLGLAQLGGWRFTNQVYFNFGLAFISFILLWRTLVWSQTGRAATFLLVIVSAFLFTPLQWINWIWAFQTPWFLANLMVILAIWLLVRFAGNWYAFGGALAATAIGVFSLSSAIAFLPIAPVIFLLHSSWLKRAILFWLVGGAVCGAVFLNGLQRIEGQNDFASVLSAPLAVIFFGLAYIGAPLYWLGGWMVAALIGAVGIILFSFTLWELYRRNRASGDYSSWQKAIPWITLALFGLANAALASLGRANSGINSALTPRYVGMSSFFWLGFAIVAYKLWQLYRQDAKLWQRRLVVASLSGVGLLITVSFGNQVVASFQQAESWSENNKRAWAFLYDYENAPNLGLTPLHPNTAFQREEAAYLKAHNLVTFSATGREHFKEVEKNWRSWTNDPTRRVHTFSLSDVLTPTNNVSQTNTGSITLTNARGIEILHLALPPTAQNVGYLRIQSEHARTVFMLMDNGDGFSPDYVPALPRLQSGAGHGEFVMKLPPDIRNLRLEIAYPTGQLLTDNLKIEYYRP
jgi:hypothetical protein